MRIPTILKRHLSTLVLVLLASTLAMAQYDDGQYQILQARYGTARSNVDVTAQLKELAREDRTIRIGNSTFCFAPDPGVIKILPIYARGRNGRNRMSEYTEGSSLHDSLPILLKRHLSTLVVVLLASTLAMAQYDDGQYQILQARYGTARSNVDVTAQLKELARE